MKVQRISVGVAETGRDCGKAGFAKSGPQIEGSPHRRRERPDLIRGHAHVRPRALARDQQRIGNERFICVENRVPRDSERTRQSACRGKARSSGQLLFENRLAQLNVDLAVQRARKPRLDRQGQHGRVRMAFKVVPFVGKVALYRLPFLDGQLQGMAELGSVRI
jgi:hypothetical protein